MSSKIIFVFILTFVSAVFVACSPIPSSIPPASLPEPESAGALAVKEYCGDCHGLPGPTTHTAENWRPVVERMNTHRVKRALGAMSSSDFETIVDYLKKYAKQ